jgi:hypothetical protein
MVEMYDYSLQHLARQRHDTLLREARAERLARIARTNEVERDETRPRTHGFSKGLARVFAPVALRPARIH